MFRSLALPAALVVASTALGQTQTKASIASPFPRLEADQPAGVAAIGFSPNAHSILKPAFDRGQVLRLTDFALPQLDVDLVLRPVSAMEPGATAIIMNEDSTERLAPSVAMFQGHIEGHEGSAFLAVSETMLNGYVSLDGELIFLSSGGPNSTGQAWVTSAASLPQSLSNDSWCHTVETIVRHDEIQRDVELGSSLNTDVHIGDFYVELDQDYRNIFGTDQQALDYANTLMTATSEVYRRDFGSVVNIPSGYMRLWNSTPPWGVVNDFNGLFPFQDWWSSPANPDQNLPRAGVHLFTTPVFGGIAYLPALCDFDFGYALSSVFGFFPYPIQHTSADNWDLFVTAHEWGHNHGSPHTFDYGDPDTPWEDVTPFDACTDGTGPDNGTIMSYCHLEPGGVSNVGMRFHPSVQDYVRPGIEAQPCFVTQNFIAGDYDYDGDRDAADLAALDAYLAQGFESRGAEESFDMNEDGTTDSCDRDILAAIVNVAAPSATVYNGSGSNASVYSSLSPPAMGEIWMAEIDASGHPGAGNTFILGHAGSSSGMFFNFGELLIDLTSDFHFQVSEPSGGGTASYAIQVTNDKAFVGLTSYTQGVIFGGGFAEVTNGIELFINFQ